MARCHGTTMSGERCKRAVPEGSRYCAGHADQGDSAHERDGDESGGRRQLDPLNLAIGLAVAGAAVVSAVLFRRWFRLP